MMDPGGFEPGIEGGPPLYLKCIRRPIRRARESPALKMKNEGAEARQTQVADATFRDYECSARKAMHHQAKCITVAFWCAIERIYENDVYTAVHALSHRFMVFSTFLQPRL